MVETATVPDVLGLTAEIVSAHVSNNSVSVTDLPALITEVHRTLTTLGTGASLPPPPEPQKQAPAVPVKKSITPDYLVCLEDGKKMKMLKRHLQTSYGISPEQYREKWGLGSDYPMVAPNYAKRRSALAKSFGLGSAKARSSAAG